MSALTPEQEARRQIDRILEQSGWSVQHHSEMNITAGLGVAVREFPLSVLVPPVKEQAAIVAEVERRLSISNEADLLVAASSRRSSRLRQSILKRAFEGKLVPQDPSDDLASVVLERMPTRDTHMNPRRRS